MSVVQEAAGIVETRRAAYGDPLPNHENIAAIWSRILKTSVSPHQVVLCMIGTKLSRLIETPDHRDSMIDLCGYADCLDIIMGASHAGPDIGEDVGRVLRTEAGVIKVS